MKKNIGKFAGAGLGFLGLLVVIGSLWAVYAQGTGGQATGERYCEIALVGCPQDYDGDTLVVPLDAVSISAMIRACGYVDTNTAEGTTSLGAPAIMFVIDHSISMGGYVNPNGSRDDGADRHDRFGNRFKVTMALIDSVYAAHPDAEVGIVIFSNALVFDSNRDSALVQYAGPTSPTPVRQSYLPLKPLNYETQTGGTSRGAAPFYPRDTSWIGLIKNMFDSTNVTSGSASNRGMYVHVKTPIIGSGNTDISLAFEAAIEAFENTNKPKENQYIIFLSDGEPNVPTASGPERRARVNNYVTQTASVPTTYTVFLNRTGNISNLPASLQTMTNNISANSYSTSNPNSNIWLLESNYDDMLALMMESIIRPMIQTATGETKTITITSVGVSDSGSASSGGVTFSRSLPLDTNMLTSVEMNITYDVKIEIDEDGTVTEKDTIETITYAFHIRRAANPPASWMASQNLNQNCGSKPTLDLRWNGEGGGSLVDGVIKDYMNTLQIVFDNTDGIFDYKEDGIRVLIMNDSTGMFYDSLSIPLTKGAGDIWTANFDRVIAEAARANNILEHAASDSIILFFRNPRIPLDVIRIAVPFVHYSMEFHSVSNPTASTVYGDTVRTTAGENLNLHAIIFDADKEIVPFDPAKSSIVWSPDTNLTANGAHGVFNNTRAGTYTITATYKEGGTVIEKKITIVVEPGELHYLRVVFDTTANSVAKWLEPDTLQNKKGYEFKENVRGPVTFYALEYDKYGNLIGFANGSDWTTPTNGPNGKVIAAPKNNGSAADVTRDGHTYPNDLMVVVTKNGISDTVYISIVGSASVTVGPNPFVPGRDDPLERLKQIDAEHGTNTAEFYGKIIQGSNTGGSGSGGGGGAGGGSGPIKGVLVAATSPRDIKVDGNGNPVAAVMIYDAVGNIVYRSKPGEVVLADDDKTFGLVWNGKNKKGRYVGPGTYLVRIVGTQDAGQNFSVQRKVGVTIDGKRK